MRRADYRPSCSRAKTGEAYDIANPAASATIREMAELAAKEVSGGRIEVVVNAPDVGYTPARSLGLETEAWA
jgi:hypothetical protein